ncbi:MAG: LTA synthase family protein [Planctomycetes bacterium]|nr:LTA synthase family protein [Planctomycetota bacterium]
MAPGRVHSVFAWAAGPALALLPTLAAVRVYEYARTRAVLPEYTAGLALAGIRYDLHLGLALGAGLLVAGLALHPVSPRLAAVLGRGLGLALALAALGLAEAFAVQRVPLGADVFGYSLEDVLLTVRTSRAFRGGSAAAALAVGALYLATLRWGVPRAWARAPRATLLALMALALVTVRHLVPAPAPTESDRKSLAVTNKLAFFLGDLLDATRRRLEEGAPARLTAGEGADPEVPFLHPAGRANPLGPWFCQGTEPPDLVFLLVEGLGRAYAGPGARLGSFTPGFDDLTARGLYWENCLSTTGRTFGVLPSVLGSLPFARRGFLDLGEAMPRHQTLVSVLREQGYVAAFHCGCPARFDGMELFLRRQGVEEILDEKRFPADAERLPAGPRGFSWGYSDRALFRRDLDLRRAGRVHPRIDVFLTLASHDPFEVPDPDVWLARFERRLAELGLTGTEPAARRTLAQELASFLYADAAVCEYLEQLALRPEFQNTIVVITGDHQAPEIPLGTKLERFHVPLLILSPLLLRTQRFSAVVSHFDLAPSLLALLHGNFGRSRPEAVHWIGTGLDTGPEFRCARAIPLLRNKNEGADYLLGDHALIEGRLYRVREHLYAEAEEDSARREGLEAALRAYRARDLFATLNDRLLPAVTVPALGDRPPSPAVPAAGPPSPPGRASRRGE